MLLFFWNKKMPWYYPCAISAKKPWYWPPCHSTLMPHVDTLRRLLALVLEPMILGLIYA